MYITKRKVKRTTCILFFAVAFLFAVHEITFRHSQPPPPSEKQSAGVNETFSTQKLTTKRRSNPLYSDEVINPHPFNFTMPNRFACVKNSSKDRTVFLLILVKCRPQEIFNRTQIRKTWGGVSEVDGKRTLTMFLVGVTINSTLNAMVVAENNQHHDIIQENFIDDYRNLTYKTMMGWRWASEFCPDAEYVASADADVLLNVHNIVRRLVNKPRKKFAEGKVHAKALPFRGSTKWNTSAELYPEPTYAPYFAGMCYVLSADVAAGVFKESVHVRFLPWDDAFVGLVLKRLGVRLKNVRKYLETPRTEEAIEKALTKGQAVHVGHIDMKPGSTSRLMAIWKKVARTPKPTGHRGLMYFLLNLLGLI